ncbi:TRAP transporter small permease [Halomonas binhaiensis]|nr:TRAP transporter small permease [Halomonas binhaiensis]
MKSSLMACRSQVLRTLRGLSISVAVLLLAATVLIILYGVVMRYLLGGSPIWMDELSRFLIIASVMFALGAVWVEGGHMRVSLLERVLPGFWARCLVVYQWLLTLVLSGGAAWLSYRYAQSTTMFSTLGLGISRSIPLMTLPIGFSLLFVQTLCYGPHPLRNELEEAAS